MALPVMSSDRPRLANNHTQLFTEDLAGPKWGDRGRRSFLRTNVDVDVNVRMTLLFKIKSKKHVA